MQMFDRGYSKLHWTRRPLITQDELLNTAIIVAGYVFFYLAFVR